MNRFQDTRYKTYTNGTLIISNYTRNDRDISDTCFPIQRSILLNVKKTCNFISGTVADRKYSKMATVLVFSLSLISMAIRNGQQKPGT